MIGTIAPELAGGVARAGKTEKIARSTQARRCCPAPRTLHSGRRRRQCTILLANCTSEPRTLLSGRRRRQCTILLANCTSEPRTLHSGRRRRQCTILLANCTSEPRTLHSGRRRRQYTILLANCTSETADFNFGSYSVHLGVEWPVCVCVCVCVFSLIGYKSMVCKDRPATTTRHYDHTL